MMGHQQSLETQVLTTREQVEAWARRQHAEPALLEMEGGTELLVFRFDGCYPRARRISWSEFHRRFRRQDLALLVQSGNSYWRLFSQGDDVRHVEFGTLRHVQLA